jgi:conjugal transfer pilus assembly protein TraV
MRQSIKIAALFASATLLQACSGLDGPSNMSCAAPDGVSCISVSGIYANSMQNNLPSQKPHSAAAADSSTVTDAEKSNIVAPLTATTSGPTLSSGDPIRSKQRVLRIWIAPWEDDAGDLRDQSFVYLVVENGRWLLDHNRQNIVKEFSPEFRPNVDATKNKLDTINGK